MTIPDFGQVPWVPLGEAAPSSTPGTGTRWQTPEGISVPACYGQSPEGRETFPGLPPFVRGPYATMYVMRPWTVR